MINVFYITAKGREVSWGKCNVVLFGVKKRRPLSRTSSPSRAGLV